MSSNSENNKYSNSINIFNIGLNDSTIKKTTVANHIYDVIILGAGISGLSSGYYLKKANGKMSILVLEAKDRVGGRTQTVELNCSKNGEKRNWDLGGQWVTDCQTHITSLLKELNIETYKQYNDGISILESAGRIYKYNGDLPFVSLTSSIDLRYSFKKWNDIVKESKRNEKLNEQLDVSNAKQVFYKNTFTNISKSRLDAAVRTIFGLESEQLNSLFVSKYTNCAGGTLESLELTEVNCGQEKKIKGGAQQISQKLLEKLLSPDGSNNMALFCRAAIRIDQENYSNLVYVYALNRATNEIEIYRCRKLISSIPLTQYSSIQFKPELPSIKRNLLSSCKIGNYIKFIFTYEKCFWREKGFSGGVLCDGSMIRLNYDDSKKPKYGPISIIFDATTDDGEPALVGFISADAAVCWSDRDPDERRNEIVATLMNYFGDEAAYYLDYAEKDWNKELYSGGCPTVNVVTSGIMKDYERATREPFLNIHFSGTESSSQWMGYMDGAVESGIRVANEILYNLYKNNPNIKFDYNKTHQKDKLKESNRQNKSIVLKISILFGVGAIFLFKIKNLLRLNKFF